MSLSIQHYNKPSILIHFDINFTNFIQTLGTKEASEHYKGCISRPKIKNPSSFESSENEEASVASKTKTSRKVSNII